MQSFLYCPWCGTPYEPDQATLAHKLCRNCGKHMYDNLRATGSAVIMNDTSLLLIRRGVDPYKGLWDVPGGFCEPQEHPEETVRREIREEVGVECTVGELFGVYAPIPYTFEGKTQNNVDLFYRATLQSTDIKVGDDAVEYKWFPFDQLPRAEEVAGFPSAQQVIREISSGRR